MFEIFGKTEDAITSFKLAIAAAQSRPPGHTDSTVSVLLVDLESIAKLTEQLSYFPTQAKWPTHCWI